MFVGDYNTLILDEPTNYLDIYALEALEKLLKGYEGTILFVSHDREFVSSIATKILAFLDGKLELFDGNYKEFQNRDQNQIRDLGAKELVKIELNITNIMTKLGNPFLDESENEMLEIEFQKLLEQKRKIKH